MNDFIFNYFSPIPSKQWKQKIQYDLEGLDYQNSVVSKSIDGVVTLPFNTKTDTLKKIDFKDEIRKQKSSIHISVKNTEIANKKATEAINKGIESVYYVIFDKNTDIKKLCNTIDVPIFISCHFLSSNFVKLTELDSNITILVDPIGKICQTGNWYRNAKFDFNEFKKCLNYKSNCLSINQSLFHDAGATPVQQLAYAISIVQQYHNTVNLENCKTINYTVAVGTDFFIELAKLEALRLLHTSFCEANKLNINCTIIQQKSFRNLRLFDNDINKEITAIEHQIGCYAFVDYISNIPNTYKFFTDSLQDSNNEISGLINQCNKEYISINDSIYIENLTLQLVEKSILLFENIQRGKGFTKQLQQGIIQQKIKEKESVEQQIFNTKTTIKKPVKTKHFLKFPFLEPKKNKTLWMPITKKRLASPQEKVIWDKLYN